MTSSLIKEHDDGESYGESVLTRRDAYVQNFVVPSFYESRVTGQPILLQLL
jgi:hypothetical protein